MEVMLCADVVWRVKRSMLIYVCQKSCTACDELEVCQVRVDK